MQPYNPYTNPYLAGLLPHHKARTLSSSHHAGVSYDPAKLHAGVTYDPAKLHRDVPGHHAGLHDYYVYDVGQIPECAYTNKHYYNLTFCLQDDYYPT